MRTRVRRNDNAEPNRVQRWDRVEMPVLDPATRTPQGYLILHASVARPGVFDYVGPDGVVVRELVRAETLHDAASLTTLAGLPVTLLHPDQDVTPDNVDELGIGVIGPEIEILAKTGHVRVTKVIQSRRALDAIDAGVLEASLGYACAIIEGGGEHPEFGPFDQEQGPRLYNHSAIVPEGRHGETVRLRADSGDRQAVNRQDAAPAGSWRRVRLDATPPTPTPTPPTPTPTPAPQARRDATMHLYLFAFATLLGLGVTRADGKYTRNDQEITEEQLVAAITKAIQSLQEEATETEPVEGEMTLEAAMDKIKTLEAERDGLLKDKSDQEEEEEKEVEKADRADLDKLADRMRFDRRAWTANTTANDRRLALAISAKLLPADSELRTDAKPSGVDLQVLKGVATALPAMYPEGGTRQPEPRRDSRPLAFNPTPPPVRDPNDPQPREDEAPAVDPHRQHILDQQKLRRNSA